MHFPQTILGMKVMQLYGGGLKLRLTPEALPAIARRRRALMDLMLPPFSWLSNRLVSLSETIGFKTFREG